MEKVIPIQNKTDSLPTIIILDPVTANARQKKNKKIEQWLLRGILFLLSAK